MLDAPTYIWNPNTKIIDKYLFIGSNAKPIRATAELASSYRLFCNVKFYIEDLIATGFSNNIIEFLVNYHIIISDNNQASCQLPFLNRISSSNPGKISDIILDKNTKNFIVGLPYASNDMQIISQNIGPNCIYNITENNHFQRTKFLGNIGFNIFFDDFRKLVERISYLLHLAIYYKKRIIFLGGEHTLTYFITVSHSRVLQNKIRLIQLDAHHDMYSNANFAKWPNHANFISFLIKEDWLNGLIQVGTRDWTKPDSASLAKLKMIKANSLKDRNTLKEARPEQYYNQLSIDIDILDPKSVSDVIAPISGGWTLDDLLDEIKFIFREVPIYIMDICEVCGGRKGSSNSAAAAGHILVEIDQAAV